MTDVKRFEPYTDEGNREGYGQMEMCEGGDWVRATDYDALAAKLAEVEAERDHWEAVAIARQARGIVIAQKLDAAEAKLAEVEAQVASDDGLIDRCEDVITRLQARAEAALPAAYRLGLEDAASRFDEIAQHDQGGIDYSDLVGIPISNREQLVKSVKDAEMDAKYIRALLTPTAAELMARINEGEKQ